MLASLVILAQTADQEMAAILKWLGVLVVVAVLVGFIGVFIMRRLRARQEDVPGITAGFTLADLRQMHARGQLTDEEFAAAKGRLIAQSRAALRDDDPATRLSTGDPQADSPIEGPENPE